MTEKEVSDFKVSTETLIHLQENANKEAEIHAPRKHSGNYLNFAPQRSQTDADFTEGSDVFGE